MVGLILKPSWSIQVEGKRPKVVGVRLSEFSDRLPNYKAYEHQARTVEEFSSGKDVLLTAGLASGKTEAALAALEEADALPAVFVYPTRALARDQHERFMEYGYSSAIADSDHNYWRKKLAKTGCEILVTNPEMIWRHYRNSYSLRKYLTSGMFRTFVFDEIHFYPPAELNKLLAIVRTFRKCRFLFLSATVGNPKEFCVEVSRITGRECTWVSGEAFSAPKKFYSFPGKYNETILSIANWVIENDRKALFFFPSRSSAERWYLKLRQYFQDKVVVHHGALPRKDRREAELAFKMGAARIMLTVKTLQQGIDIGDCDTTLHTHLPPRAADFHQREGRSGRREGVEAISVLTSHEEDPWSTRILQNKRLFERLYLRADPEHLLASAHSPLTKRIDRHDHPGFYSGYTVSLVDEKGREIATYGVDDVPFRLVPGALLLRTGNIYVIKDIELKDRKAIATPAPQPLANYVKQGMWFRVHVDTITNTTTGEMRPDKLTLIAREVVYEMDNQIVETIPANVTVTVDALVSAIQNPSSTDEAEAALHLIHQCLREHGIPLDAFKHVVQPNKIIIFEHPPAVLHRILMLVDPEELEEYDEHEILTLHPICPWHGEPSKQTPTLAANILQELQELAEEVEEKPLYRTKTKAQLRLDDVNVEKNKRDEKRRITSIRPPKKRIKKRKEEVPRCFCGGKLRQVFHAGKRYWYCDKCGRMFQRPPTGSKTTGQVTSRLKEVRKRLDRMLDEW